MLVDPVLVPGPLLALFGDVGGHGLGVGFEAFPPGQQGADLLGEVDERLTDRGDLVVHLVAVCGDRIDRGQQFLGLGGDVVALQAGPGRCDVVAGLGDVGGVVLEGPAHGLDRVRIRVGNQNVVGVDHSAAAHPTASAPLGGTPSGTTVERIDRFPDSIQRTRETRRSRSHRKTRGNQPQKWPKPATLLRHATPAPLIETRTRFRFLRRNGPRGLRCTEPSVSSLRKLNRDAYPGDRYRPLLPTTGVLSTP